MTPEDEAMVWLAVAFCGGLAFLGHALTWWILRATPMCGKSTWTVSSTFPGSTCPRGQRRWTVTELPTGRPHRPDPPCTTHHAACRCREAARDQERAELVAALRELLLSGGVEAGIPGSCWDASRHFAAKVAARELLDRYPEPAP